MSPAVDSVGDVSTRLETFAAGYSFVLDDFQVRACRALEGGRGVLVAAPTGSGKTVVGEFAVHLALAQGRKAFYTTPIKALSNQKYTDLVARHGAEAVGLLTGDTAVNGEAPVVVMTTEVLRNMLYAGSPTLTGLGYVVMDEVHYLADRFRGPVWEEVIIHLPQQVQIASLSATVSNAEEFGAWLAEVRGDTDVVVWEHRPVPLWQHVLTPGGIVDLFADDGSAPGADGTPRVNPDLRDTYRGRPGGRGQGRVGRGAPRRPRRRPPARPEVLALLDRAALLPAITFVFSRAGCEAAVEQCMAAGVRLTSAAERAHIQQVVAERTATIPEADRGVLGYRSWVEALERGIAAHHAGLLPTFKEVVEHLFAAGLVKMVFATETLALGINMPARTVVLEKLVKWNGESHAEITPAEYTQLTGRAGRRGIDIEGHAVVLWHEGLDPQALAGLASTRTYPLRSSFRPTYNMAVNLVAQVGRERARQILETSFAQYQADQGVVGLARQLRRQEEALAGYAEAMTCHLGDFGHYMDLRRRIGRLEAESSRSAAAGRRLDAIASLEQLRRGDVIRIGAGRRAGWAVVVEVPSTSDADGPRPTIVTETHRLRRLGVADVPHGVEPVTRMSLPRSFDARSPHARRDVASHLRTLIAGRDLDGGQPAGARAGNGGPRTQAAEQLTRLRAELRSHPCHGCADREDHARWAERHHRLRRDTDTLRRRIDGRTNTIARVFDRVCDLLAERGYLTVGDSAGAQDPEGAGSATGTDGTADLRVTKAGQSLRRIYTESDLLVAECLRTGVWAGLDGPGLAACVSALVFESRGDLREAEPRLPGAAVREALQRTVRIWSELADQEGLHRLETTREPDLSLAWAVHRWAAGRGLAEVLGGRDGVELSAGDFVRWCRQIIDLLGQIQSAAADAGDQQLRRSAAAAVDGVRRGVIAYAVA
ncbi:MAG: DEAD/DEAH box helicase [Kineosporiaceae bacterium]|nr:DEAD/DEAH box helicase [Kineosporiaceae bacterium]